MEYGEKMGVRAPADQEGMMFHGEGGRGIISRTRRRKFDEFLQLPKLNEPRPSPLPKLFTKYKLCTNSSQVCLC